MIGSPLSCKYHFCCVTRGFTRLTRSGSRIFRRVGAFSEKFEISNDIIFLGRTIGFSELHKTTMKTLF